jgi:hypothetical protein
MARGDILAKIEKSQKSPTFSGRRGNCKPNIKNLFYQILVNIPKILHVKNEEDPVENKKMAWSDVLAKLGERKNGQVQATPKTSRSALFSYICALKDSNQNSLVSKSEKLYQNRQRVKILSYFLLEKNSHYRPIWLIFI